MFVWIVTNSFSFPLIIVGVNRKQKWLSAHRIKQAKRVRLNSNIIFDPYNCWLKCQTRKVEGKEKEGKLMPSGEHGKGKWKERKGQANGKGWHIRARKRKRMKGRDMKEVEKGLTVGRKRVEN